MHVGPTYAVGCTARRPRWRLAWPRSRAFAHGLWDGSHKRPPRAVAVVFAARPARAATAVCGAVRGRLLAGTLRYIRAQASRVVPRLLPSSPREAQSLARYGALEHTDFARLEQERASQPVPADRPTRGSPASEKTHRGKLASTTLVTVASTDYHNLNRRPCTKPTNTKPTNTTPTNTTPSYRSKPAPTQFRITQIPRHAVGGHAL